MAILRTGAPGTSGRVTVERLGAGLGALALFFLGGCILVDALVQSEPEFAFSHRLHVEDEGLDCSSCHLGAEDSDEPGMPVLGQCMLCHEDIDAEKPPARQVASLFDGQVFRAARAGAQSDEIRFPHLGHVTRGMDCTECHAEVAQDDGTLARLGSALRLSMEDCLACHATRGGPQEADCSACHAEIDSGSPPPSHRAQWRRYHGSVVRARSEERADRCTLCHQPSECTTCHNVEMPANHGNYWRRRGHGVVAAQDRESCVTCHDTDSCERCHEDTRPMGHSGSWGAPLDRHCLTCHEPLRDNSCGVCHHETPSHDLATPLPADHLPGMNCRMCHGNGQPLPHVDNGQSCITCHR